MNPVKEKTRKTIIVKKEWQSMSNSVFVAEWRLIFINEFMVQQLIVESIQKTA